MFEPFKLTNALERYQRDMENDTKQSLALVITLDFDDALNSSGGSKSVFAE